MNNTYFNRRIAMTCPDPDPRDMAETLLLQRFPRWEPSPETEKRIQRREAAAQRARALIAGQQLADTRRDFRAWNKAQTNRLVAVAVQRLLNISERVSRCRGRSRRSLYRGSQRVYVSSPLHQAHAKLEKCLLRRRNA